MAAQNHVQITIPKEHDNQNHVQITIPKEHDNQNQNQVPEEDFDYSERAQWLRAAVLEANDGLVSTASLMMGVGAVQRDVNTMILAGFAWLFLGACSMAIGEFVSVYSQLDTELVSGQNHGQQEEDQDKDGVPNPFLAAIASAVTFSLGGIIPIIAAAFISNQLRLAVIVAAVTLGIVSIWMNWCLFGQKPYGEILCQSFNWWLDGHGHDHYLRTDQTDRLYWGGDVLGNFYSCPFA